MNRVWQLGLALSLLVGVIGCAPPEPEGRIGAPSEPAATTTGAPATTDTTAPAAEPKDGDAQPSTATPPTIKTGD